MIYKDLRTVVVSVKKLNGNETYFRAPKDEPRVLSPLYTGEDKLGSHIIVTDFNLTVYMNEHPSSMVLKYRYEDGDVVEVLERCHREEEWNGVWSPPNA